VQTLETDSAVLDLHFHIHRYFVNLLGVATSKGSIDLYRLLYATPTEPRLDYLRTLQLADPSILVLSFTWYKIFAYQLGATLSNGEVLVVEDEWLEGAKARAALPTKSVKVKHELEAWTMAFTPIGLGGYSGGDDMALRHFVVAPGSITSSSETDLNKSPYTFTWTDKKIHSAGVTAILPLSDEIILTGSYDDYVRVIFAPCQGRRQVLGELNLGGGVWRLKLMAQVTDGWQGKDEGSASFLILASCMHAGTRVIKVRREENDGWSIMVLGKFEEHNSMNYGSDFQPVETKGRKTIVSTSFYDKLLCVWHFSDEPMG